MSVIGTHPYVFLRNLSMEDKRAPHPTLPEILSRLLQLLDHVTTKMRSLPE